MGLVIEKHEFRDLTLYVSAGVALVFFIFYMSMYHPTVELFSAWTELGMMTAAVFGTLLKVFWDCRKEIRLWMCLTVLLALHLAFYAALQRFHPERLPFRVKCILYALETSALCIPITIVVDPGATRKNEPS